MNELFDQVSKAMALPASRRTVLSVLGSSIVAAAAGLVSVRATSASASGPCDSACPTGCNTCCKSHGQGAGVCSSEHGQPAKCVCF